MQTFTKPDLFVEVAAGGTFGRTKEKDDSDNPVFNETVVLWPRQPTSGLPPQDPPVVTIRVFDDDVIGKDAIGVGTIVLQPDWETMPPLDTTVRARAVRCACSCEPMHAESPVLLWTQRCRAGFVLSQLEVCLVGLQ